MCQYFLPIALGSIWYKMYFVNSDFGILRNDAVKLLTHSKLYGIISACLRYVCVVDTIGFP